VNPKSDPERTAPFDRGQGQSPEFLRAIGPPMIRSTEFGVTGFSAGLDGWGGGSKHDEVQPVTWEIKP
jgi:hypothetical protein